MPTAIPARTLAADRETLVGLRTLSDYHPVKPSFSVEALGALEQQVLSAREARLVAWKQYEAAYAQEVALGQQFHNDVTGARRAVKAQYDGDAQAIQAVGMKRTSDHKRMRRAAT
jgi:hypothetical protein